MVRFTKILRLLPFAVLTSMGCTPDPGNDLPERVDHLFAEWDRPDSPGCALAIIRDGETLYQRGYGMADLEHSIPIEADSVFYIGSVSKQFVAFALLLLEEQGRLSLDDDVRKYLPEFPDYGSTITLRHLIHHTSGIRDYLELWMLSGRDYLDRVPTQAAYELICRQKKLHFQPGERHSYSNSCYFLMPLIVEKVTGKAFKDFAQDQIFGPLGMADSHFHDDTAHIIRNRATGYERREDGSFGSLGMRFALVGSGGLYTTVVDLAKWDANFYENKLGQGGSEIIRKMYSAGRLNDGTELDYAFALVKGRYRGLRTVHHSGALGGYRAELLRFPDQRFSVIILSNLAEVKPLSLAYQVADICLNAEMRELSGEDRAQDLAKAPAADTREAPALSDRALAEYSGEFYSGELRAWYTFSVLDRLLVLKIDYSGERTLRYVGPDRFTGHGIQIRFQRGGRDRVSGFLLDSERIEDLEFKRWSQ